MASTSPLLRRRVNIKTHECSSLSSIFSSCSSSRVRGGENDAVNTDAVIPGAFYLLLLLLLLKSNEGREAGLKASFPFNKLAGGARAEEEVEG